MPERQWGDVNASWRAAAANAMTATKAPHDSSSYRQVRTTGAFALPECNG